MFNVIFTYFQLNSTFEFSKINSQKMESNFEFFMVFFGVKLQNVAFEVIHTGGKRMVVSYSCDHPKMGENFGGKFSFPIV